jgi:hypothetical protein
MAAQIDGRTEAGFFGRQWAPLARSFRFHCKYHINLGVMSTST